MAGDIDMKKIISLLMTVVLLLSSISVFAETTNGLEIESFEYDPTDFVISIDGKINGSVTEIPVIIQVFNSLDTLLFTKQTLSALSDNTFSIDWYIPIDMENEGEYTVEISEMFYGTSVSETFGYSSIGSLYEAVSGIASGIPSATTTSFAGLIDPYEEVLNIDKTSFANLGNTAKTYALNHVKSGTYEVPDGTDTVDKRNILKETAVKIRQAYLDAIKIGQYEDITDFDGVQNWLSKYFAEADVKVDDPETDVDETLLYAEFKKESTDAVFAAQLIAKKGLQDLTSIRDAIYDSALVSIVKTEDSTEAQRVVGAYGDLFDIDESKMDELTPDEQGAVYFKLNQYNYDNCSDIGDKIDELVGKTLEDDDDDDDDGGHWGGPAKDSYSVNLIIPGTVKEETTGTFADLGSVAWAEKEIKYLAENAIVNGKGENKFYPHDNVTRAEFLKMLSLSMGFDVKSVQNETTSFNDVDASQWYYPYIVYCEKAGIVMGNDSGEFRPNDKITREDIAVIIYRANFEKYDKEPQAPEFEDNGNISNYAVNAVGCLYHNGIVKGNENNNFQPKNNSTRAEAAVMVYRTFFEQQ